mmetsp:Transcript_2569/g.6816  ORF Transcript_2569/g.6816 Transcript_2569/m.6816 type:complete len:295 (+) Transcript_2569:713-1597(+)
MLVHKHRPMEKASVHSSTILGVMSGILVSLDWLCLGLVIPMRGYTEFRNLVHLSRPNLDFQSPVFVVPLGSGSVVQALVSVFLGIRNVVLESGISLVGSPYRFAEFLGVVAQSTFSGPGHSIRFVWVSLLGIEDNSESECIGNLGNVVESISEHLLPGRVAFFDTSRDVKVCDTGHEYGILFQDFRHGGLHVGKDLLHAFSNVGFVRVTITITVTITVGERQTCSLATNRGANALGGSRLAQECFVGTVLSSVENLKGGMFQFVFESVHSHSAGEGRVDAKGFPADALGISRES